MCSIREVGLVLVLYYKNSVNQWLEKQGLLVVRLRLREYSCSSILFTRLMFWSLLYYYLCFFYYIYIFSIITYTSATWWIGKYKYIQILNKVQNRVLYLICVIFHTTLTHVLELEAFIFSLGLYLDSFTRHTIICFNKLSTNNPILQWLSNNWYNRQSLSNPSSFLTKHSCRFKLT